MKDHIVMECANEKKKSRRRIDEKSFRNERGKTEFENPKWSKTKEQKIGAYTHTPNTTQPAEEKARNSSKKKNAFRDR